MQKKHRWHGIICTIFFIASVTGCGENKSRVDKGFNLLSETRFEEAREEFSAILKENERAEARFGRGLADLLSTLSILDYVYTLAGGHPSGEQFSPFSAADENQFLYNVIHTVLTDIRNVLYEGYLDLLKVSQQKNFEFEIVNLPVRLGRKEVFNLRGRWTSADVTLLASFAGLASGVLDLIMSQNLMADYYSLFEYAKPIILAGGIDPGDPLKPVNLPSLLNILVYFFEISPDFLTVDSNDSNSNGINDGVEKWNSGADALATSTSLLYDGLQKCITEGNNHYFAYQSNTLLLATYINPDTGEEIEIRLPINEEFMNAVSAINEAFNTPSTFVLWENHLTPVLASLVVTIAPFIDTLSVLITPGTDPQSAYTLIKNILAPVFANSLALSPARFFSTPRNFRDFLPVWRADFPDPLSWNFAFEWECSEYSPPPGASSSFPSSGFLCSTSPFTDGPHFTDQFFVSRSVDSTLPDGITSYVPYIPFTDPSFGELLFTDVNSLKDRFPDPASITAIDPDPGLRPATQSELNAIIQYIFNFILSIPGVSDILLK